jgi:hypothetical protein
MRVRGKSLVEISREVGSFLKALNDELWLKDVERRYQEESGMVKLLSKQRKKNKKKREGREMTQFVAERIAERAAKAAQAQSGAPTPPGQIKKDGMVNGGSPPGGIPRRGVMMLSGAMARGGPSRR